jgi:cytochrome c oxidase subunit 2
VAMLGASGCSVAVREHWKRGGLPEGVTNQSDRITTLWQGSWIAALLVGIVVWGLILWACVFFRRRRGDTSMPRQVRYNVPIEVLYTVVPLVMVAVFFAFTARDETKIMALDGDAKVHINVVGKRWSWDFNYTDASVYESGTPAQPPTLYLPVDQKVEFTLTSRDVIHSFWVPAFLFKMDVIPGRVNRFEVTPEKTGTFAGRCAELCGVDHSRMLFNVKIVSQEEYDAHLAQLRLAGQTGQLPAELGPSRQVTESTPEAGSEAGA